MAEPPMLQQRFGTSKPSAASSWLQMEAAYATATAPGAQREDVLKAVCLLLNHGLFREAGDVLDAFSAASGDVRTVPDATLESMRALSRRLQDTYRSVTANVLELGIAITADGAKAQLQQSAVLFKNTSASPLCLALQAWLLNGIGSHEESERLCQAVQHMAHAGRFMHAKQYGVVDDDAPAYRRRHSWRDVCSASTEPITIPVPARQPAGHQQRYGPPSVLQLMHDQCMSAVPLCTCLRLLRTMVPQSFTPRHGMEMQSLLDDLLALTVAATSASSPPYLSSEASSEEEAVVALFAEGGAGDSSPSPSPLISATSSRQSSRQSSIASLGSANGDEMCWPSEMVGAGAAAAAEAATPRKAAAERQNWALRLLPSVSDLLDIQVHVLRLCEEQDVAILRAHLYCLVEDGGLVKRQHGELPAGWCGGRRPPRAPSRLSRSMEM